MNIGLREKYPLFLSGFKVPYIILRDFRKKNYQILYFMKVLEVGAQLFHADRWRERQAERRDEDNSRFSQNRKTRLKPCA